MAHYFPEEISQQNICKNMVSKKNKGVEMIHDTYIFILEATTFNEKCS